MIYADTSFLFSLYAFDDNSAEADKIYQADGRRPLILTPWQRFEFRNTVRLAAHRYRRAGQTVPFNVGNVLKVMDEDLKSGILRHQEPDWRDAVRLAETLSGQFTEKLGPGGVDLWHVAAAMLLRADSFWTFDAEQAGVAGAVAAFKKVRP
jgi:hypothetical protein